MRELILLRILNADSPLPGFLTATVSLPSGEQITMRPLRSSDAARLGAYFAGVSAETRARFGLTFDQATANTICATLDPTDMLLMIATVADTDDERIIAYFLLKHGVLEKDQQRYEQIGIPLLPDTDSTLAPSVTDAYQNRGVGSLLMGHVLECALKLGRQRIVLWSGVQATNARHPLLYEVGLC
jgi:GNAT superfamily N-acetyltransferase